MSNQLPSSHAISALLTSASWGAIEVVESTGSTNTDLSQAARSGALPGTVLISMEQTSGRGRLNRQWVSPKGASVSMSLLLQPRPVAERWGWLSLLAGIAVSSAIAELAPEPGHVQLKWPNDVLIDGYKVCGILSERVETSSGPMAVVGIGINVTLTREELPVPQATSLALEGFDTDQNALIAGVLNHFERYYRTWQEEGSLRELYQQQCASVGATLTIQRDAQVRITGTGYGVDDLGRLQIATTSGIETFAVGDVIHAKLR